MYIHTVCALQSYKNASLITISSTANEDYTPVNAIVTIPAGANRGCVFVPILDDLIVEMDETVPLRASLVVPLFGVSFGVSNAAIIIVDIDSKCQNF